MTRRSFFSMFTAAVASVVAAVKVRPHFKMIRIGGFKSKRDPFGDWPIHGRITMAERQLHWKQQKWRRMNRAFELASRL